MWQQIRMCCVASIFVKKGLATRTIFQNATTYQALTQHSNKCIRKNAPVCTSVGHSFFLTQAPYNHFLNTSEKTNNFWHRPMFSNTKTNISFFEEATENCDYHIAKENTPVQTRSVFFETNHSHDLLPNHSMKQKPDHYAHVVSK